MDELQTGIQKLKNNNLFYEWNKICTMVQLYIDNEWEEKPDKETLFDLMIQFIKSNDKIYNNLVIVLNFTEFKELTFAMHKKLCKCYDIS